VQEGQAVSKGQTLAMMNQDVVVKRFADYPIKTLIGGIVAKIFLKPGETVSPALPVITVENIHRVKAIAKISEKNLSRIKVGNTVEISADGYPGQIFTGKINEISPVLDAMSRSAEVTILVDNYKYPKTPLKPGMYSEVKIIVKIWENQLLIPYSSVLKDANTGENYVFTFRDNLAKKIIVETGLVKSYGDDTSKDRIQIKGDLKVGDFIVYMGHQFLNDNDKIRFVYENKKFGPSGMEGETESKATLEETKKSMLDTMASLRKGSNDFPNLEKLSEYAFVYGYFFADSPEQKKSLALEIKNLGEQMIKLDDNHAAGHYWLASSRLLISTLPDEMRPKMEKFEDIKQAKLGLEKVLTLNEEYFESGAYRSLGLLYYRIPFDPFNDKGKGLNYLKKAVELSPENRWNYQILAEMLIENKEEKEAKSVIEKGLKIPVKQEYSLLDKRTVETLKKKLEQVKG